MPGTTPRRGRCTAVLTGLLLTLGACSSGTSASSPAPPAMRTTSVASTTTVPESTTTAAAEPVLDGESLQAALEEWSNDSGAGVSAAVLETDGTTWFGAAGHADETTGRLVTPEDTFRIGSISKTFAAVVVLQLVEEGVLGLDQPVAEVVPDLGLDPSMTVRHVLGHRTGLRDGLEEAARGAEPAEPGLVIELSTRGGLLFEPGTHFDYCNANYILAALLIEAVEEMPAHQAIRERILMPLGLDETFMAGFEDREVTALPDGDPEQTAGYDVFDRSNYTAGGMVSTPHDLVVFAEAVFDGRLLDAATLEAMVTPSDAAGEGAEYGLGVELTLVAGRDAWGHRGGVRGYLSGVFFFPAEGTSIAVVSNAWRAGDIWELLDTVAGVALRPA